MYRKPCLEKTKTKMLILGNGLTDGGPSQVRDGVLDTIVFICLYPSHQNSSFKPPPPNTHIHNRIADLSSSRDVTTQ